MAIRLNSRRVLDALAKLALRLLNKRAERLGVVDLNGPRRSALPFFAEET